MKADRYEPFTTERQRLSGFLLKRGSKAGAAAWPGLLLGSLFAGVGVLILFVGTRVVNIDPASVRAPVWVLKMAGAAFAMGGSAVLGFTGRHLAAEGKRRQAARQYPNEPALADHLWHPDGFAVSQWTTAARALALAIGMSLFLSIFNWWAFWGHGGLMVQCLVGVFDVLTLALWWATARQVGCAFKFGRSRIAFTRFPYRVDEPVVVRWHPTDRMSEVRKGTFTLRCVEEWWESRGSGKSSSVVLVHEHVCSGKWIFDGPRKLQVKDPVELRFELPPDARPTRLAADRPVFWELEADIDLPGLDFKAAYLVPIYGPKAAPPSAPRRGELERVAT